MIVICKCDDFLDRSLIRMKLNFSVLFFLSPYIKNFKQDVRLNFKLKLILEFFFHNIKIVENFKNFTLFFLFEMNFELL